VISFLNEVEVCEVQLAAMGVPSIEVAAVREVVVDEAGEGADDEGVAIAVRF
jgi:hypothetical protein